MHLAGVGFWSTPVMLRLWQIRRNNETKGNYRNSFDISGR